MKNTMQVLVVSVFLLFQGSAFAASNYVRSLYSRIDKTTSLVELEKLETEAFFMQLKIERQWPDGRYMEEYSHVEWMLKQLGKAARVKGELLTTQGDQRKYIALLYNNIMWVTNSRIYRADAGLAKAGINTPSSVPSNAQRPAPPPIPADVLAGTTGNYPQEPTREPSFVRMQRVEKQLALEMAQSEENRKRAAQARAAQAAKAKAPAAKAKAKPKSKSRVRRK